MEAVDIFETLVYFYKTTNILAAENLKLHWYVISLHNVNGNFSFLQHKDSNANKYPVEGKRLFTFQCAEGNTGDTVDPWQPLYEEHVLSSPRIRMSYLLLSQ
jgi:hypothetical protein